ncbi:phosphoenolpyruvate synthase [Phascolarctobacterium faecium]|jgi:pyruvate,water dikinase|uniref:Phosphoenolpyruvate synthase n=1 Tax=Phascolarctobacterium faecium TaxID=33025 RepID=A0A7X2XFN8_9FIRM|nr:phosphoenolpyruvate synthase [Phascolarctobacterium faecium]MTS81115.1 phosphoenolpyruvate synthase [Phascolarctobacterium faecium]MTT02343.1 phosphoenolpyruvate synthase [Phascolarctobacterium faecium]MTT16428.1 phosphoenolpyruvate synthase [Phascolarctobacterium faecium]MTT34526.1 phosphoenolpyruvate synthase [Phascolarctobacterium faecium]MTT49996.1 phosphoenolpyruvate synthase [Phascolarctobacterium faecium]
MKKEEQFLLWFEQLERKDVDIVGGKSSSLGEMTAKTDVPVPYGFATTAYAYRYFIKESGLEEKMRAILSELTDVENSALLRSVSSRLRDAIMAEKMPQDLQDAIGAAYVELGKRVGEENPYVAVRSSATAEDLPDASFAGQQDTYLNVQGAETIIAKVKECYASCFTDRAVYYREKQGFDHIEVALSAVVQMMVFSKTSGVMFTVNVATGDDNNILIEAAFGLGEYVVQGTVTPDNYTISKHDHKIIDRCVNEQDIMLVRKKGGDCEEVQVPEELRKVQTLTDEQILELADYAKKIEQHYGCYMDMEWGVDERTNKIWILQARPETVWSRRNKEGGAKVQESKSMTTTDHKVIVKGLPASPGKVSGRVHVILDPSRIDEFKEGEILVTEMTAPDWVPAMKKAKAIVTDSGGMTCHASIVSRELGIPCIVGTKSRGEAATVTIPDGIDVTIDATHGVVYEGIIEEAKKENQAGAAVAVAEYFPPTGTKVYMNLGDPELADKYSSLPCDGIGLMREEFIWTTYIHEHPLYLIKTGHPEKVVDQLAEGMRQVCQAMAPRPVTLRFSDFKSSEYRDLKGGDEFEPYEPSALLGWRGASRYYDPKYIEAFKLECQAVVKVREEFGLKNLNVMIPFCRNVEECEKVVKIMAECGLERGKDFKVWLMAEIPSNIILADQFNKYVDGYSIGSNDLTMLVLGCDRDNDTVSHIYDERNLAVRRAVRHLIEVAHSEGKTVSICGQAPSVYPEFCEFLIKSGIDSISVNPDTVKFTKKLVAQVEQRVMLDALTGRGRKEVEELDWK